MTNRLSKWSRRSSQLVCLLAACGLMYACKDEFTLDDEKPSWLNSSIYESLQERGNFKTYLRLLSDKDVNPANARPLSEVLSRTGSKTVFVADDDAWEKFFKHNATLPEANPWHNATSYENLSSAQKKLLIHTSMLNNAIVMENLASSEATGSESPVRGEYMRRYTDVEVTDTVTYLSSSELPISYSPVDKDYWWRFREENGGKGLYMAENTPSMMLHFTSEHMTKNTVNDKDFSIFMGQERVTSDVHIYGSKLLEKDGVCENGYVNVTDAPLCPLASMAEVIRTNGKTNIFSHMLDRYSAPFYVKELSEAYHDLHQDFNDSIFMKRYVSDIGYPGGSGSSKHTKWAYEPGYRGATETYMPYKNDNSKDIIPSLKFDPAWNGLFDEVRVEKDMAAMFIPSDEALWTYFTQGGGLQLIETYGDPNMVYNSVDDLYRNIDNIPLGTLQSLINIIMLRSFVGSVPSKMTKLRDDAQEQLFYEEDIQKIDTCLLASNGAVYIMSDIYGPADYTSVTSPAYISKTNNIMKWAIYDQEKMGLNYYAYLKAMQSRFTFFLPSDSALFFYYDPTSMKSRTPRVMQFSYKNEAFPVKATNYNYYGPYNLSPDYPVGTKGKIINGQGGTVQQTEITNRLKDILESHTIVHNGTNPIEGPDEYFLSKNGNAIKVIRDENNHVISAMGGFQLENLRQGVEQPAESRGVTSCNVTKAFETLKNGQTYVMDSPLVPTYRSVYSILTNDLDKNKWNDEEWEANPYSAFYDLCQPNDTAIIGCGLVESEMSESQQRSALKRYNVFVNDNGPDYNVQFFNNYRYTIFVPTNNAIHEAIAAGLPTWDEIMVDYHAHSKIRRDEEGNPIEAEESTPDHVVYEYEDYGLETKADSVRIRAKISYLTNFIRYHFADNSVFSDKTPIEDKDGEMVTSSYDSEKGVFCKIHIDRVPRGDEAILRVCDDPTFKASPSRKMEVVGEKNVLARDMSCSRRPVNVVMTGISLDAASAAVIHQIDGVLNHTALVNGRHDAMWSTVETAQRYLKRYGTIK